MGMESYFFKIQINNKTNDQTLQFFKNNYNIAFYSMPSNSIFKKRIVDETRIVIDKKIVVGIDDFDNGIYVNFELCFSNYEKNLQYIYEVLKNTYFSFYVFDLIIYDKTYSFENMNFEYFKELLLKSHKERLDIFNRKYGNLENDVLPHDFYDFIRKHKRKD